MLLLQCVLTGRAQEAYSAICGEANLGYDRIKSAVLKSYDLVPEAYRQKFRNWVKGDQQSNVEFVHDLTSHFKRWCAAANVNNFDDLGELIVLQQFKNTLPQRIAMYVSEQKSTTAFKAAELADEFVLTHKTSFLDACSGAGWKGAYSGTVNPYSGAKFVSSGSFSKPVGTGRAGSAMRCNYCHREGHWKNKCPLLKTSDNHFSSDAPAMCCSAVLEKKKSVAGQSVGTGVAPGKVVGADPNVESGFEPFITDATVALVGSDKHVQIKVLHDTAAKYSFIVESALPFSAESATGDFVLMRGMEMGLAAVPRHTIVLDCDLVQGVVPVGVCPALPLDEVQMILGNDLAGSAVWAGVPPPVVVSRPLISGNPSEDGLLPDVFPVCAVTRAQSRKMSVPDLHVPESGDIIREQGVSLPDLPPFVLKEDWVENQKTDSSLSALWEEVLSAEETREVARGYFVQGDLLVRKWVPCVRVRVRGLKAGPGNFSIRYAIWPV